MQTNGMPHPFSVQYRFLCLTIQVYTGISLPTSSIESYSLIALTWKHRDGCGVALKSKREASIKFQKGDCSSATLCSPAQSGVLVNKM